MKKIMARHRRQLYKRILKHSVLAIVVLMLLTAAYVLLRQHADALESKLQASYDAAEWSATEADITAADTALYRLINPRLAALIDKAKRWQAAVHQNRQELARHISIYENLEAARSLTLEQRASTLRRIRKLPAEVARPLLTRWENLFRPLQEEIRAQRLAYLADLKAAAQPLAFTDSVQQDADMLRKRGQALRRLISTFSDAAEAYGLDADLITPAEKMLRESEACLEDAQMCLQLRAKLNSARTAEQHTRALTEFHPKHYPPALAMAAACRAIPDALRLTADFHAHRHNIPATIHPDILAAVLENGPSFTPAFPATSEQVHLMQDAFTSQTLRRRLYKLTFPDGAVFYADTPPVQTEDAVTFSISPLDPHYTLNSAQRREHTSAQAPDIRTVDPTPLLKATAISHDSFFLSSNVPDVLGRLTTVQSKACPALAKAYLYHTLLELIRLHKGDEIIGLRYSPTLEGDIRSFRRLAEQCGFPLTINCWLSHSEEAEAAEKRFEQWFAEHANRDYAAEMRRALSRILRERPKYLGYVDARGVPRYREQPPPNTRVLYYSGGALTAAPAAPSLHAADAFSPIIAE